MDFELTAEQKALRDEFETFFSEEEKNAPADWGTRGLMLAPFESDESWQYHRSVADKLAKRGWLALPWPKKYGGKEHSYIEQLIFNESRAYHRVPGVDLWGPNIVAPSILEHGSDELKQEWLPRIANAEINWCQGWSEPNSGSDLASLQTRATEDGDDYVIYGQKIWTSGAHRADRGILRRPFGGERLGRRARPGRPRAGVRALPVPVLHRQQRRRIGGRRVLDAGRMAGGRGIRGGPAGGRFAQRAFPSPDASHAQLTPKQRGQGAEPLMARLTR